MSNRREAAEARAQSLRSELDGVRRVLARLPDPPEPLTAGELAACASPGASPGKTPQVPDPPADAAPGTIAAARAELAAGRISAVDLIGEAFERARAARELGAFLGLREEEALNEARGLTGSPAAAGRGANGPRPLLGIPLSVKDIVDVAGMTTTSGSKFPHQAPESAPAWRALSDAGAILLGKNNLQEFAFGVTGDNPTFGRTRNPHDPGRIPGGSSSGSAVAVATGIGYGSVGTDTGGSIRIPASLNGVFGLKPSYGAVPRAGVTPLSWSLDHVGPIARSAQDIGVLFEVLSGRSPGAPPRIAGSMPLAGVRVGVPLDFFYTDLIREARQAAENIVAALVRLGAERVEVRVPEVELGGVCRNVLAFAEAAVVHAERLAVRPDDFSEDVRRLLDAGNVLTAADLLTALRGRRLVTGAFTQLFDTLDILVLPSTPAGAPEAGDPLLATGEEIRPGLIRLVGPFNFTGLPALQVPAGFDASGMPLGAQLVARPGGDFTAIRLAAWLEASGAVPMRAPRLRPTA